MPNKTSPSTESCHVSRDHLTKREINRLFKAVKLSRNPDLTENSPALIQFFSDKQKLSRDSNSLSALGDKSDGR